MARHLSLFLLAAMALTSAVVGTSAGDLPKARANSLPPIPQPIYVPDVTDSNAPPRSDDADIDGVHPTFPYSETRILVKPKRNGNRLTLAQLHAGNGAEVVRTFSSLGGLQVLRLPNGESVEGVIEKYRSHDLIEYAERDHRVRLAGTAPNDPKFLDGTLWALHNVGQNNGVEDADIDAPEAWATLHSARNVVVALLDTGVRYTHEDLAANMWVNPRDSSHGINVLTGSNDPIDDNGHGTHLAGVIGAVGDNAKGVVGVAWNVRIMACKFVDKLGDGSVSGAIAALEYARTNGADIVNASWGIGEFSLSLSNALQALNREGIIVVAAAGNEARNNDRMPYYPASYDLENVVTVAATTRTDDLLFVSNFGQRSVDLAAPGQEILSTYFRSDDDYRVGQDGTSSAAACVSGALALLRARHPNENSSLIVKRLLAGTDPLPSLEGKCVTGGRLNLQKALGPPPSVAIFSAKWASQTRALEFQLQGIPDRPYVIQASIDLIDWFPVATNRATANGVVVIRNAPVEEWGHRFFRALPLP